MTCKKTKKIFVTFTLCSLFLSSGCLQNFENSSFLHSSKSSLQNKGSESDGILALKEVFDSSVEKIPTL